MLWKICFKTFAISLLVVSIVYADERRGTLVLAFDDGYMSWTTVIAPELAKVGGIATGYVNNNRIHSGKLSFDDLRTLQNTYGWEIGSHTYSHLDSLVFVELHGMSSWVKNELLLSIDELQAQGLKIYSFVFPYNKYTKELVAEVTKRLESFRRADVYPLARGKSKDGSIPGAPIDIGNYIPLKQQFEWVDIAHEKNQLLFLYGHEVLPDDRFFTGMVASVTKRTLVAQDKIGVFSDTYLCLVPDTHRQIHYAHLRVKCIDGNVITVANGDLTRLSKPGVTFMIGPCNATRLSDFRAFIEYAAKKLYFQTVHKALDAHR